MADSERRIEERRRAGQEASRQWLGEERRQSERRQQAMWEDPNIGSDLGPDPEPSFDEWERLADEDYSKGYPKPSTAGAESTNFNKWRENRVLTETDYKPPSERVKYNILSSIAEDEGLGGGFIRGVPSAARIRNLGLAGTAADMAAAYAMSEGTPQQRALAAGKAGIKGALGGAVLQGVGRLASLANIPGVSLGVNALGKTLLPASAALGAYNIYKAGEAFKGWRDAEAEAAANAAASQAKYGTVGKAMATRYQKNKDKEERRALLGKVDDAVYRPAPLDKATNYNF